MFPRIRKLSDLSGCLSDTSESSSSGNNASTELFTVKNDEHGFVFIKYKHAAELEKTFPDPALAGNQRNKLICQLRRECRGIVFKKVGEEYEIVLRKFHKFFNVNERPETQLTKIKWNRSFRILEKMDGSLVSPLKIQSSDEMKEEKLCFTTMLGFTDVATMVDEYVEKLKELDRNKLLELCNYCIDKKWTPLFEFCSLDFKEMVKLLKDNKWNEAIKVVKVWKEYPSGVGDASNLLKEMYSQMQVEGYVIRFDDGDMYKVKTDWYSTLHGIETTSSCIRDRHIIKCILNDSFDDFICRPYFSESTLRQEAIQKYRVEFQTKLQRKFKQAVSDISSGGFSADSIAGHLVQFIKKEKESDNFLPHILGENAFDLFKQFIVVKFELSSRLFDKHRKLLNKWLEIDFSAMKPLFFTDQGVLTEPKQEKSSVSKSQKSKNKQTKNK